MAKKSKVKIILELIVLAVLLPVYIAYMANASAAVDPLTASLFTIITTVLTLGIAVDVFEEMTGAKIGL